MLFLRIQMPHEDTKAKIKKLQQNNIHNIPCTKYATRQL